VSWTRERVLRSGTEQKDMFLQKMPETVSKKGKIIKLPKENHRLLVVFFWYFVVLP